MDTQPDFGFKELLSHIIGGVAKAVSERNGETRAQHFVRSLAATRMILEFSPRDSIEAILASHCAMFHEVLIDSVRETLRAETDTSRLDAFDNIVSINNAFTANLDRLERYWSRRPEGDREDIEQTEPATTGSYRPSAEMIAACAANQEAMAALDAGDPERFAKAMGVEQPSEAYIEAARRAFNRTGEDGG